MAWPKNRKACKKMSHFHIAFYLSVFIEAEMHTQSGERMTALHSRLQQEAEKIRKWKNAMELDIKHKVNKSMAQCSLIGIDFIMWTSIICFLHVRRKSV